MNLLGKATDSAFWREVREKDCYLPIREKYLERWALECEETPPNSLRYSDWCEFWKSGKRIERNYFGARQQMMASAFLALIYPEEEKYFIRLQDQIYAICNEFTWCVPAHYGKPLEGNRNKIDLFAAETSLALSEIYTIFENRLDEFIKIRIKEEVERRILQSMRETPKFGFESMSNNWSAVCTASVGGSIMLLFPECFYEFKPRFDAAMELYLSGYKDDGVCLEGASYWGYGFGFFMYYADMLRKFTDGKENYFELEKVKKIATFMQKMFLSEKACVSFSDGGRTASFAIGLLHYLKKEYPEDIVLLKSEFSTARDGCARFTPALRAIIWFDEDMYYNPEEGSADFTFFAESSEWFIRRTPNYGFAAKGGNNKEPHNHNDLGSFIYAKAGRQVLVDIGPGAYTKQYFSGERYKTFQACSRSHSVPIVAGAYQTNGLSHRAENTVYEDGCFSTDIHLGYDVEGLEKLERKFMPYENGVKLCDSIVYTGDGIITERFVTLIEPVIAGGKITLEDTVIYYDALLSEPYVEIEVLKNDVNVYLINFDLPTGAASFSLKIE